MITPALLISATGTFILSTSNRLGRVVDRVRGISEKIDELMHPTAEIDLIEERKEMMIGQLVKLSSRADLLQRSLTAFYLAGAFVACSVAIGVAAWIRSEQAVIAVALGLVGGGVLFYGSVMLILEARLAVSSLRSETRFLYRLVTFHTEQKPPVA